MNATYPELRVQTDVNRPVRIGVIICLIVFGMFGLWSAIAPIDGAARAVGIVGVKSYKKVVQHLEGGIIKEIKIRNGDPVEVGDPIVVLDDTQSLAQLGVARTRYVALKALESRLIAERDKAKEITFSGLTSGDSDGNDEIATQTSIFESRRRTHEGSLQVLDQRIDQLKARLEGLIALQESKNSLANSYEDELGGYQTLVDQGFSDTTRLRELERHHAQYVGEASDLTANISSTEIEIGETRLQMLQQENEFHNDVVVQLGDTRTKIRDIRERISALEDVADRTVVRSPESGVVNNLKYHTVGAVIDPGSPIADIVPVSDDLIIEARVSPLDVDRVSVGQEAIVRFSTFSFGAVPSINGRVISLSADSIADAQTGDVYYLGRIEVTEQSLADLGELSLIPGMPAEVFITTGSRTFLQYLFKPISNALARSFRED